MMKFKLGDHMAVFGGTGSGKTKLGIEFLKQLAIQTKGNLPIDILDTKMAGDFNSLSRIGVGVTYFGNDKLPPLRNKRGEPFIVVQPEADNKEWYDAFFHDRYKAREPRLIYIDEISSVTGTTGTAPKYFDVLFKQGRGLGISMIVNTQMARFVPLTLTSQIMHAIVMNLNSDKDKKKLIDLLGDMAKETPAHKHGFFYRDLKKPLKTNPAVYFEDFAEFFNYK